VKQQDIAALIGIVVFASALSYFVSTNYITPSNEKKSAEVVGAITPDFQLPDKKIFNTDAINPTRRIEIAPNSNNQPFTEVQ